MSALDWKKNTALFLGGQTLSLFGSMLTQFAIMWHITLATKSGAVMTLYVVVGVLPMFFMSPFGGVWADRFNRKRLINLADGGIAFVTLVTAVVFAAGCRELWLLFVCAAVRALGQGVHSPAVNAFIPQITPAEHLSKVNGINGSIQSCSMIAAPMASGALLTFVPLEMIFLIDVVTAAAGITVVCFLVKIPAASASATTPALSPASSSAPSSAPSPASSSAPVMAPAASGVDYFHDMREGFRYAFGQGFIKRLIIISIVFHIVLAPVAFLSPLQVARNFGGDVWRLTATEIAFSAGMTVGGIVIGFWGGFKNRIYSLALANALLGAGTMTLGLAGDFRLYVSVMLFLGLVLPLYNTPALVLFQTRVDPAYMGRVFGVFAMAGSLMLPAGMLLFGPLGDVVNIDWLMLASGGVMFLLAVPFVASKVLR
ncbi:MAG: MFS transporter, partial [Opitutaceae bacterium]|nr:MFS transporter [Opitutaceae bacterium]